MSFRDTIEELERQLEETRRFYLRSFGWDVTYDTPGAAQMWQRNFDAGVIMMDMGAAVQMTMTALDPIEPIEADSAE